jgi:hypothetical protein
MDTKVIVVHGFSQEETVALMRACKAALPTLAPDMAFAMSTPTSLEWKLRDLVEHVGEEHREVQAQLAKRAAGN